MKEKWWLQIAPPQDDDPIVLLYLPWNLLHHGDVTPDKREWLLSHYSEIYSVFENSGFPVINSLQTLDLDAAEEAGGFDRERLQTLPLYGAPYNHMLFGLAGEQCLEHAKFLIEHGVQGNVFGPNGEEPYFFPEWDIARKLDDFFAGKKMILPSVGKFAVAYSDCAVGDRQDASVMDYDAIGVGNHVVVPMKGVDGFHAAWFAYQRDDSDVNLAGVIQSVQDIVSDPKNRGKVVTLFVDGESILVGGARSFWSDYPLKGYELWQRLFVALKAAGLQRYFNAPEHAIKRWVEKASLPESQLPANKAIGRHYAKWGGWLAQEKAKGKYRELLPGKGRGKSAHFLGALYGTSDHLSTINTREGKGREFTDKDGVTFSLDYDHTIPFVAHEAAESLRGKGAFLTRMKKAREKAAKKFALDGKPFGPAEEFTFWIVERLYERYENLDMAA